MQLTGKALERAKKLVQEKMSGLCESCNTTPMWGIQDHLFQFTEYGPEHPMGAFRIIPLILVTCPNCGNVRTLNAFTIGLLDKETGAVIDG